MKESLNENLNEHVKIVTLNDYQLAYEVYGSGKTTILCFHGNSRSAEDFKFLERSDRKIISIHLFLHQYSTFDMERIDDESVQLKHVEKLLRNILKNEKVNDFHWVAYSQGGLFTLSLFPLFAEQVKSLYLIAPDGMNNDSFYSRSPHRKWANILFKRWTEKPKELMRIVKFLIKVRILDPKMLEFMKFYTDDPKLFKMAYNTWKGFRNIRPDYELIKSTFEKYPKIRFHLFIGEFDRIITVKTSKMFLKNIGKSEALVTIPYGHNVFKPEIEKELYYHLKFEENS